MSGTAERRLAGKVALVIGAGRPLGRALALGLAGAGADIAAHDLLPTHLEETRRAVAALGVACRTYSGDTGKGLSARALVEDVLDDFTRLDILVHCLQVNPPAGLLELDEWDWQRTLELNLTGPYLLMRAAAAAMSEGGGGTMVNILATPAEDAPQSSSPSQFGLAGLTQWAAAEFLTYNINCYAVEAGAAGLKAGNSHETAVPVTSATSTALTGLVISLCTSSSNERSGKVIRLAESH